MLVLLHKILLSMMAALATHSLGAWAFAEAASAGGVYDVIRTFSSEEQPISISILYDEARKKTAARVFDAKSGASLVETNMEDVARLLHQYGAATDMVFSEDGKATCVVNPGNDGGSYQKWIWESDGALSRKDVPNNSFSASGF